MKTISTIILSTLLAINALGQEIKVPTNYQLKKIEDYEPYKDSVKMVANWMVNTPLNQYVTTRELANKFVLRWVSGAPYTNIEIRGEFTNDVVNDKSNVFSSDLLLNYIAGMTLIKIEKNDTDDLIVQEAGIKAMLQGYKSIRENYKNKFLEKLLKLENKGKLTEWIKENTIKYEAKDKTKIMPKN